DRRQRPGIVEVDVRDDRQRLAAHDLGQRLGRRAVRYGDAHDIAAGVLELFELADGRLDVLGDGRAHRLDGDRGIAADLDVADEHGLGLASRRWDHRSRLPPLTMRAMSKYVMTTASKIIATNPAKCTNASFCGAIRRPPRRNSMKMNISRPPSTIGSGSRLNTPRFILSSAAKMMSASQPSDLTTSPVACAMPPGPATCGLTKPRTQLHTWLRNRISDSNDIWRPRGNASHGGNDSVRVFVSNAGPGRNSKQGNSLSGKSSALSCAFSGSKAPVSSEHCAAVSGRKPKSTALESPPA